MHTNKVLKVLLLSLVLLLLAGCAAQTPAPTSTAAAEEPAAEETEAPAEAAPEEPVAEDPATDEAAEEEPTAEIDLVVFAAASLTDAFDGLAEAYMAQNPGVNVVRNYASSSQLATQLIEGAQADVYASANENQMGNVIAEGLINSPTVIFATNKLTVVVPADNPAGIDSVAGLAQPSLQLVLALPGVPARDYANQILESMSEDPAFGLDFIDAVFANLVSEEDSVRQVSAKIALGEADAGIVYTSDVTPDIADQVLMIPIPDEYNVTATYPIGILDDAPNPEQARAFIDFVLSEEGQAILAEWGFQPPPGD
jgi:molybdate transport system substrate-binding protein